MRIRTRRRRKELPEADDDIDGNRKKIPRKNTRRKKNATLKASRLLLRVMNRDINKHFLHQV